MWTMYSFGGSTIIGYFQRTRCAQKDCKVLSAQEAKVGSKGAKHHGEELWPELQGQALGEGVRPSRGGRYLAEGLWK